MTSKEKANELANKMYNGNAFNKTKNEHLVELDNVKRCALIAVYETINNLELIHKPECVSILIEMEYLNIYDAIDYWQEVELEIEKL